MSKLLRKIVVVGLIGGSLLSPVGTVSASAATGCRIIDTTTLYGRVGYLWFCSDGYHGQIANASTGDDVQIRYKSGGFWYTYHTAYVPSGKTSANTRSFPGGEVIACIHVKNRPGEFSCTN